MKEEEEENMQKNEENTQQQLRHECNVIHTLKLRLVIGYQNEACVHRRSK